MLLRTPSFWLAVALWRVPTARTCAAPALCTRIIEDRVDHSTPALVQVADRNADVPVVTKLG